jgi:hypothetical protein
MSPDTVQNPREKEPKSNSKKKKTAVWAHALGSDGFKPPPSRCNEGTENVAVIREGSEDL